jgi:hypothetical protein
MNGNAFAFGVAYDVCRTAKPLGWFAVPDS